MTTLTAADRDFWPTQEEADAPGFRVIASIRHGDLAAGIYVTDPQGAHNGFYLTWSDGVANSWRERHWTLHNALARVAMLAFCEVSGWELFAKQHDEAEFARVSRSFFREVTA